MWNEDSFESPVLEALCIHHPSIDLRYGTLANTCYLYNNKYTYVTYCCTLYKGVPFALKIFFFFF